ncbi:glycosyltransferase [Psychromonas sp. SR45-3]|uniref:glycosyltransferase n=1 Tax=Psychromonas sp. SR45-3 TaxID=2760930 RepID=UPI0015FD1EF4|nr:glycosyltransferase [Psychromonas sp. SR45-3]MBB1274380.1 glycosyltransferase family 4 protein [Psychromonas sp. SR45-3]
MNLTNKSSFLQHCYRWLLRLILVLHYLLLKIFKLIPYKQRNKQALTVLATGTFYSDHWLVTHLRPMANASNCASLTMVSSVPVPDLDNVSGAYAPKWLTKILGQVGARLVYFTWLAITTRPDVLVGFHILVNGLFVVFLAKIIGAKSVYICGGGPREVRGGGIETENRIFNRIGEADFFIEKMLLEAVNEMDLIVSMGTSAITYFKENGVDTKFEIVPGGFDDEVFKPNLEEKKKYDLILIGRLSDVKRVDRFLHAIKQSKNELPELNAVIVGDGPDKKDLEKLAEQLGLRDDVDFVGWQDDVNVWLQKSKCFVLTSDSEGLSQALIQAMMSGLPAITSDVGDLSNLIKNDYNGYLVSELNPEHFSTMFIQLFKNESLLDMFSKNALESTRRFSIVQVKEYWQIIFNDFLTNRVS